jgi:hypothetical protein
MGTPLPRFAQPPPMPPAMCAWWHNFERVFDRRLGRIDLFSAIALDRSR